MTYNVDINAVSSWLVIDMFCSSVVTVVIVYLFKNLMKYLMKNLWPQNGLMNQNTAYDLVNVNSDAVT